MQIAIRGPVLTASEQAGSSDDDFASLVERHSRFVFRIAYAILRNVHDSEDAVQETFLRVYKSKAWSRMEDERAFLARTVWRVATDKLSRRRPDELDPSAPFVGIDPEQAAILADWNSVIHRLVDALPEELRQPLALSAIEELNSRQIAGLMGIPEGTVRTRLMRARKVLKEKLTALQEARHDKR